MARITPAEFYGMRWPKAIGLCAAATTFEFELLSFLGSEETLSLPFHPSNLLVIWRLGETIENYVA